ncbi:LysM peptidoglycan-binding domain-containing protein [Domibacillus sp. A3M-37]|uniref:peptidoglycan endopeptidase n=1 Tax=Domibacillus sp. A3M-37 TaxID=2962037 RepID=UPI0020B7EC28|nr:peptidoglycan endopeptidase [Domibacillus sp. A3M-37]MCP3761265.1 LysM peptidoglycan-binding domain-containing protein [Domibacillus sp. A3M-37]
MNKTVISLAAAAVISAGTAAAAEASELHTVKQGDTLFSIANQYKLSVVQLKELNNLESDALSIDDPLIVSEEENDLSAESGQTEKAEEKLVFSAAASSSYTVQSGDSLSVVASRHKMSAASLKQLNGLKSDVIFVGQKLKVSGKAAVTSKPSSTKTTKKPAASTGTYTVQSGDSLGLIAARHKTSLASLKQLNGLKSDVIFVGQKLKVSGKASVTSKPSPTKTTTKPSSSTGTYTVQSGDSLGVIASRYKTSTASLKKLNGLTSDVIYAGQKLKVNGKAATTATTKPSSTAKPAATASKGTYIVKSGDSLGLIASRTGMTVASLKQMNSLKSDVIFAGQKLKTVGGPKTSTTPVKVSNPSSSGGYSTSKLISTANSVMGIPYVWGGSSTSGFDCSGFIYYAYKQAGKSISRTNTEGYYNRSHEVSSPAVGDLVFFSNTYKKGISHMGIYIGGNQFIHASSSAGVTVTSLSNSYFKSKFTSFKRFY